MDFHSSFSEHLCTPTPGEADAAESPGARLLDHVASAQFPCVGAKAALARDAIRLHECGALGCPQGDAALFDALAGFAAALDRTDDADTTVRSFVAVFDGPLHTDEPTFERLLWSQLQRLHDLDRSRGNAWAPDVARDPDDPRFSLSLAGHPFFVIGLHAGASRIGRRFERPALVFNSHRQFDRLRADGRYAKMQAATRARDIELQGSINPNLADYGTASETRQYSGRAVPPEWRCPLRIGGLH
ncbi:guanitoxin biosynthesis heme-dependent pre-guanitoxin N-hydroxylase GntA [Cognatilysobacter lacus]|uniref:YqcI/YcgG family protein n=1 Tax=Cognatilysobacter lacus TaxID=1643323 RepID=A0A5D8Z5C5_9GAMM|nr:guanitoxin biosynthesis heme-dependent pre-guanitoxin N-hydroxylase GntA [Lysobacter lacus]TZF89293.1 YqcI/YcgG family protein [Lysobacter lacus]